MPSPSDDGDSAVSDLSEQELYDLVHRATKDAVLGAFGTVLLVGVGVVLFLTGLSAAVGALGIGGVAVGAAVAVFGVVLVVWALDLLPSSSR